MTTVAVLGLGRMGAPMARNLARADHSVVLYNRTPDAALALAAELGATVAETPAAAAAAADVCLVVVADDVAVRDVFEGPDGLLAGARAGSVLVNMSTVTPAIIGEFAGRAKERGVGLLDVPVSGSATVAAAAQLTVMVGGDAADLERARPALEPLSKAIFHIGPLGSGAAMKLAVNTLVFGLVENVAEGLVLAETAGIERAVALEVFAASAAGAPLVTYNRAAFLDPEGTPPVFALRLAAKDMRLILELAARHGVSMPAATVGLGVIADAISDGRGESNYTAVAEHLRAQVPPDDGG